MFNLFWQNTGHYKNESKKVPIAIGNQQKNSKGIYQGCHGGFHFLKVKHTTTNARGVRTIKKHKICVTKGSDIRAPVLGAPTGFKHTVCTTIF